MTFCKRKYGMLKKAAELATLCGVKVTLLFTDLGENIHFLSNEPGIGVQFEHTLSAKKREVANMFVYKMGDVSKDL